MPKFEFPLSRDALTYRIVFWLSTAIAMSALYLAKKAMIQPDEVFCIAISQACLAAAVMVFTKVQMIKLDGAGLTGIRCRPGGSRSHSA
jgi:hypothetical protein